MKYLLFIFLYSSGITLIAQIETNPKGLSMGEKRIVLREESNGTLFGVENDTTLKYFIGDSLHTYRLWKNDTLLLEGNIGLRHRDALHKYGTWKEYYTNGMLKATGMYEDDMPVGLWRFFYANGNAKSMFTISKVISDSATCYCKTGYFENNYENGSLRLTGYFKVTLDSLYEVGLIPYGRKLNKLKTITARGHRSQPDLTWTYYKQTGEIERKVTY